MKAKSARRPRVRDMLPVMVAASLFAACNEGSAPDRNLPLEEAQNRASNYPAYQTSESSTRVWELAGRRWQAAGPVESIDASLLRSVASADGTQVFALTSDPAPYDRLYTPAGDNRWTVLQAID